MMKFKYGKLFQNLLTKKIQALPYNPSENYYNLIFNAKKQGMRQVIVTSDIMLLIAEQLFIEHNYIISTIEFMVDDEDLKTEIDSLLRRQQNDSFYWNSLKQHLLFLSENDSIDINKIMFRGDNGLFFIQVNGIFSSPETLYDRFAELLTSIITGCIK